MTDPLVSVVIPTYNHDSYLREAIESVLNQTYTNYELIVVDDGSTDSTPQIMDDFNDCNIQYIRLKTNRGQNPARNIGLQSANGEFISYLDSDDIFYPYHLEVVVEKLKKLPNDYGGVYTNYKVTEGDMEIKTDIHNGKLRLEDLIDNRSAIGGLSSITFRKNILDNTGYHDENITKATDLDFYLQILSHYHLFGIDEILYIRRIHDSNVSRNDEIIIKGEESIINKHGHLISDKHVARRYYHMGKSYGNMKEMYNARRMFYKAITKDPVKAKYWYHLLIALGGQSMFQLGRHNAFLKFKRKYMRTNKIPRFLR